MVILIIPAILLLFRPDPGHSVLIENLCDSTDAFGGFYLPFVLDDYYGRSATFTLDPGGRVFAGINPDPAYGTQACGYMWPHMTLRRNGEVVATSTGAIRYPAPEGGDFVLSFSVDDFDCTGDPDNYLYMVLSGDLNGCPIATGVQAAPDAVRSDWGSIKQLFR